MKKKKYAVLLIVLTVIICAIVAGVTAKNSIEANLERLAELEITDTDLSQVEDGVYTGSYQAFPVAAEVSVTIKDHKIIKIELIKHNNGQGSAAEVIPDRVVEAQSLEIDAVSGATYSSKVILKAIENAIVNAVK